MLKYHNNNHQGQANRTCIYIRIQIPYGHVININANNKSLISQRTKNVYRKMLGITVIYM